jgi:glycosyltransferase involved in cell wall biosynthesis
MPSLVSQPEANAACGTSLPEGVSLKRLLGYADAWRMEPSILPRPHAWGIAHPRARVEAHPLRVAVFTTSYPRHDRDPSGRFVFNTVAHLRAQNVEVEVVGPGAYRDFGVTAPGRGGVVSAVKRRPWLALLLIASMILALRRAARRADLVHANWLAGAVIARFAGKPFIVTLHGSGTAGRFSDLALAERAPRFVRFLLRRARAVICCSEQLAAAMRGCGLDNVHAIPYGVDVPTELGPEDPAALVLYAGRLSPEKRIDVIAQAIDGLPRIIAGDGPLRALLPDALGFVSHEDLCKLYHRAAVVVLASRMEGLPNVVLEAMAHGKTVIATPVGGIPSLIEDGVTGFLVPVGDAVAMRAAIERALADPALRKRVGDAARARVSEYCSWDNVTARTLQVYAEAA